MSSASSLRRHSQRAPVLFGVVSLARIPEKAMKSPDYDYEREIPAGFYDKIYQRKTGVRYCWHDLKFRAVVAHLAGAKRLLDVGCGPGTFIGNYLGGVDCLGTDFSVSQIEYANRHYADALHRFSTQPVTSLVEAGDRFDAITMIELVEHLAVADVASLLAEARRLLAADGLLIVTTPNYRSLWPLIEWGVNLASPVRYEQQHVNKYRRDRLVAQLIDAGFGRVTVTTAVGLAPFAAVFGPRPVRWLDALEARLGHLGCGNLLVAVARL
jgi:2-polyprenyl-3-methyl-5-hydroxy-6-metoxy-1,4-benzoquinol methylase